jgi:2-polyprenyl-3-methyl-5-hydroxy-6-metoxy-1,4-benzoquinol methylase
MRDNNCPICREAGARILFNSTLPSDLNEAEPPQPYSAHYQIMQCNDCGLIFSNPIMSDKGVSILYETSKETNVEPGEERNVKRTMLGYYRLAVPFVPARERVLDIGCDIGLLLQVAKEDGFKELHGIEPVPSARQRAEKIRGSHITKTFFEDTNYPSSHFDLVCLIHVVDHLYNPRVALRKVFENLKPNGVVIAVVHNVRSLLFYLLRARFPIFNLYHHYFFDKSTLAALFAAEGYEVLEVVGTRNCYSLGFFAKRLPGVPESFRNAIFSSLSAIGLARVPITIPVGNIAIVARRPQTD